MTVDDGETNEGSEVVPETKITLVSEADLESATSFCSRFVFLLSLSNSS
jgi:hypothetical protein